MENLIQLVDRLIHGRVAETPVTETSAPKKPKSVYQWCRVCCTSRTDRIMLTGYCLPAMYCDKCGRLSDLATVRVTE